MSDYDTHVLPIMDVALGIVQRPSQIFFTGPREQGFVSVGPGHIPDAGPALFIGLHQAGEADVVGAVFAHHLDHFFELIDRAKRLIEAGDYDQAGTVN